MNTGSEYWAQDSDPDACVSSVELISIRCVMILLKYNKRQKGAAFLARVSLYMAADAINE